MSVSLEEYDSILTMKKVMEFIIRQTDIKNVDYGHTDCEPASDKISIKDMLSLFLSLVRKDERKNAKQKAIKEY